MAAQGDVLHTDMHRLSDLVGYGIRRAGVDGILTNAQVLAATSADDLIVNANAMPGTVHSEYEFEAMETVKALQFGKAIGDFTNARVVAALTTAGLVNQTNAQTDADANHLGPRIV